MSDQGVANGLGIAGLGLGLIGTIGKLFGAGKANKRLKALQQQDPNYATSQAGIANQGLAGQRLGLAQTLLNSKMPGSSTIERGIYGNQANQFANINRNATDSSQALALGAATQGQTNSAFNQLGVENSQNYQQNLQNLNSAEQGSMNENDKVFADQQRRFGDQAQIQGQINQNNQNVWGSIADGGFSLANAGMNGGFSGLFGNKTPTDPNGGLNPYTQRVTTKVF